MECVPPPSLGLKVESEHNYSAPKIPPHSKSIYKNEALLCENKPHSISIVAPRAPKMTPKWNPVVTADPYETCTGIDGLHIHPPPHWGAPNQFIFQRHTNYHTQMFKNTAKQKKTITNDIQ